MIALDVPALEEAAALFCTSAGSGQQWQRYILQLTNASSALQERNVPHAAQPTENMQLGWCQLALGLVGWMIASWAFSCHKFDSGALACMHACHVLYVKSEWSGIACMQHVASGV